MDDESSPMCEMVMRIDVVEAETKDGMGAQPQALRVPA